MRRGSFLLHFPWSRLRRTLSGTLPFEARTFLSRSLSVLPAATACPTRRTTFIIVQIDSAGKFASLPPHVRRSTNTFSCMIRLRAVSHLRALTALPAIRSPVPLSRHFLLMSGRSTNTSVHQQASLRERSICVTVSYTSKQLPPMNSRSIEFFGTSSDG